MSDAPERIWIDAWGGNWSPNGDGTQTVEYIRADLHAATQADLKNTKISEAFWRDGWFALDNDKRAVEAKLDKATALLRDLDARIAWESLGLGNSVADRVESTIAELEGK